MLSSADKVKGQGVMSAYLEQVNLVKNGLEDTYNVRVNSARFSDITHYHTIDFKFFMSIPFSKIYGTSIAYVHFVPETLEDSIRLPRAIKKAFYKYVIWFYKSVDHLVVVNPCFIDALRGYGISESRITYIPNFVSEENFYRYSEDKINAIKKEYDIPIDKFVVLGVGQVQTRKGVHDFIKTAESLPDIQFVWAGGFSFGAITDGYRELKEIVENPPANVKFIGIIDRDKMNDIYNIADLMFLPSFQELFPMSVLEAMAVKIPVLLRDVDIYEKILFDYYLKGKNVQEFIKIIHRLQKDKSMEKEWSGKSWECHKFYSRESVLNKWRNFYDNIYYEKNNVKFRSKLNEK